MVDGFIAFLELLVITLRLPFSSRVARSLQRHHRADIYELAATMDMAWRLVESLAKNPSLNERIVRENAGYICKEIANLFRVRRVCIYTRDPCDPTHITIWANEGLGGDQVAATNRYPLREDIRDPHRPKIGCVVRAWVEGGIKVYTPEDRDFIDNSGEGMPRAYKESLHVPLSAGPGSKTVCVICVDAPRKGYFDEIKDGPLLSNMAREPILHIMRLSPQRKQFVEEPEESEIK